MHTKKLRFRFNAIAMTAFAPLLLPALCGCSGSNNLLLGRVQAQVGDHLVVVTDCYRSSAPPPRMLARADHAPPAYEYVPCRDARIEIRGTALVVNGVRYMDLASGDRIVVDHGVVSINDRPAVPARTAPGTAGVSAG